MTRDDPSHGDGDEERGGARVAQQAATRRRIVEAVADLVIEEHPATISVPAVARRAGVSVATVYRYFPTKSQLLDAGAEVGSENAMAGLGGRTITDDLVADLVGRFFWSLADQLPLVRSQQQSAAGRDLRKRRRPMKRELLLDAVTERGLDLDDPSTTRLLVLVELLASSASMLELHDQLEVPVDDAAAYVTWAVRTLMRETELEQDRLAPGGRAGGRGRA